MLSTGVQFYGAYAQCNDESLLFKANASKPLVPAERKLASSMGIRHQKSSRQGSILSLGPAPQSSNCNLSMSTKQTTALNSSSFQLPYRNSSDLINSATQVNLDDFDVPLVLPNRKDLLKAQKETGQKLSMGKSRHLKAKRNSHQECKLIYAMERKDAESPV